MADIHKRVKTSPFYSEAVKMLGKRNFHLVRPDYAPAGGIKLIVHVQDRQRNETTREFIFPARMEGLAMMQWKSGFTRDLDELEKAGFRPSQAQFDRTTTPVVVPPRQPDFKEEAEKIFERVSETIKEKEESNVHQLRAVEEPPPVVEDPKMEIVLDTRVSSLITMLMLNEIGDFVNDPTVRVSLAVPQSQLSDFLAGVNQCDASVVVITPLGQKPVEVEPPKVETPPKVEPPKVEAPKVKAPPPPPKKKVPVVDPFTAMSLSNAILKCWPHEKATATEIRDAIRAHTSKWTIESLTIRVSKELSQIVKRDNAPVKRVQTGVYRKIG